MQPYPAPEIQPALDENRPTIGPNLASDQDFCKAVAEHIYRDRFYPYFLQQQRYWSVWDEIDDAFRVKTKRRDLDISSTDLATRAITPDGRGTGIVDPKDGFSAKITPSALHQQIVAKTDLHLSIAYADGLPVECQMPETMYEHPLYNPTQQSVDAGNEELRRCADVIDLKHRDRRGRGSLAKYGHAWATVDFRYSLKVVPCIHRLPPDRMQAAQMLMQLAQQYGNQKADIAADPFGNPVATWQQTVVDQMETSFEPLRMDEVFIDQTLPVDRMEQQACPIVRSHVNIEALQGNGYDKVNRPFGWLNTNRARANGQDHFALTSQDEGSFRTELLKKHGLTDQGQLRARWSMKQLWTAYPMLAVYQDPQTQKLTLDCGDGIECPQCKGARQIKAQEDQPPQDCPMCEGVGKIYPPSQRFVVQMFGNLGQGTGAQLTVLRIQPNPTVENRVPLLFYAHLTEDTVSAIPLSKSEASLNAHEQLATAHNQFLDAKNHVINNKMVMPEGHPLMGVNISSMVGNISDEGSPNSIRPIPIPSLDATTTLLPYIQLCKSEISNIHGMTDQLLGMIAPGRRPAVEMQNSFDAAKMPMTIEVDGYNQAMIGQWAWFHIKNIEAWADREWIREKTGRTTFGKVKFFTAMADQYMQRQAVIGNIRYMLEASVNDPSINRPLLWKELLTLCKMPHAEQIASDGGVQKSISDAMGIINQILGKGIPVPPMDQEPHQLYIQIFSQALLDDYWIENAPQNLPLLQQRIQLQTMIAQQQQLIALRNQIQQQKMAIKELPHLAGAKPGEGPPQANQPATPNQPPENAAQGYQQQAGAQGGAQAA